MSNLSHRLSYLRTLPRDVQIIIYTQALRRFSFAILNVIFPIYLSKLGASSLLIGATMTGRSLFLALRSLIEGLAADRFGRKPILIFTAGLLAIGGLVYTLSGSLPILVVSAILFSVGTITFPPAEQAVLAESAGDEDRTAIFSVNAFLATLMSVVGSFSTGLLSALQSLGLGELAAYRVLFAIYAAACLITFLAFLAVEETMRETRAEAEEVEISGDERLLLLKWSGVVAIDIIGGSFIYGLLSYWFYLRFSVGPEVIGALFGASRVISSFSYILGFKMARRFGIIRATVLSRLPVVAVNILTPLMPSFTIVAALRLFMALFSMIDVPLRQSYIMGIMGRRKASAAGVVTVVSRFTSAGAPTVTGYVLQYVSMSLPFFIAASFQFASAALMYLLFKDIRPPEERGEAGS
ncbi:hypothetical protein DRO24_01875 [Candidatus Bathyarchaeota archaeon]|nr:MAG: hypothetical protein DRO24_01875 [Candidatus Bathyarchaeota archaeon]